MYTTPSIREAYSMNRAALIADIKRSGNTIVYPPLAKFSKEELIGAWLERYGIKELERID